MKFVAKREFLTIVLRATTVWMGDAPMGRLYFVAPYSKKGTLLKPLRMSAATSGGVLAGRTIAGAVGNKSPV